VAEIHWYSVIITFRVEIGALPFLAAVLASTLPLFGLVALPPAFVDERFPPKKPPNRDDIDGWMDAQMDGLHQHQQNNEIDKAMSLQQQIVR
jgi:hypothetical protein